MKHRSHLWLMAALAGAGMLAVFLLPSGTIPLLGFGVPLLACLAMLAVMFFLMRGMGEYRSTDHVDATTAERAPAEVDRG
ncbi:hypothetical protein [Blastococcus sp. CT_GayMR16]|uniref:hypothetical protein n=1 Tax=Blastococcus sp. CT_GayMR16 TaxID=2559607 RepID=UPI00107443A4|nr:hypothetical protein [Blastococcus sp. CT_GayMR16]TFV89911.1 hypothetical protein E4P38_05525 [Blastococcus sp. CT_GayMR16]